ncbi:Ig-like domain repeat protein [Gemmata sp. G18]|uniref:Ig-like domain repeat protein n=1 Tax=Gemmata palustris TaxID=2822762 RepID=A0ABS5BS20_9BACT|nr:Ig-like domain repeat protein [Gemmata palustris]MBP3956537.1 Ig-like domain repeat protein [Gemmata palustris]
MKWINSILQRLGAPARLNRKSRRVLAQRLSLTCLEDRVTPSTVTWTGGGGDSNWTTAANWGGMVPTAGDDLVFADLSAPVTTVNDFAGGTSFSSITVQGANYTIVGNGIDLSGDVSTTYTSGFSAFLLDTVLGGGDVVVASGGALDFGGAISGVAGLTVSGGGTLLLSGSGSNTYTGTTLLTEGTLGLNKTGATAVAGDLTVGDGDGGELVQLLAANQIADGATVAVGEGAVFELNGMSEAVDALVMQGSTVSIGTGGTLTLSSSISSFDAGNDTTALIQGGTLDLNGSAAFSMVVNDDPSNSTEMRITSVIANGGITKSGTGTLALAGANTYAGATAVNAGVIQAESNAALGTTAAGTTVVSVASVFFSGSNLTIAEGFAVSGDGYLSGGVLAVLNGAATITGNVNLVLGSRIGARAGATLTITGVIGDGGGVSDLVVSQTGDGRTVLSGANTFDGNVVVLGGFLRAASASALGAPGTAATIDVGYGATLELSGGITVPVTKTLDISGVPVPAFSKIMSVAGANTILGDIGITGINNVAFDVAAGTTLTLPGAISGSWDFDKNGPGTLVLTGTSTHTGTVNAYGGELIVNGSLATSQLAIVESTLSGSGTLPAVSTGSGTIAPGGPLGIISTGGLTLDSGATVSVDLNGTAVGTQYDQVSVTGSVSLDGTLSVTLGFTPALGSTFTIIANDGTDAVTGTFIDLAEGAVFSVSGQAFRISYAGGTGNDVTLTALESPTATVTSSVNPAVFGQPVTFSVTVAGSGATPTGNVTLVIDGSTVETVALIGGTATFTAISSLSAAAHTVDVNYAGAGIYDTSSGNLSGGQIVSQASTTLTVVSSDPTTAFGEAVTFTATITPVAPGAGAPTGSVSFFDGATLLGAGTLSAGVATLTTSTLSGGSHTVTAVYGGDTNYAGSTSAPATQVVAAGGTTTALTTSDSETDFRDAITFTATVSSASGAPTGTVTFSVDGTVLATVSVNGSGVATFSTAALASGTHTITARFTPVGGNFLASVGTVTQTVRPTPGNDVNADGRADIIVGTANTSSHIKIFSSADGSLIRSFLAFDGFQGGVASAGGDTNGDGFTDVIAGTSATGSHVKAFDGATGSLQRSFIAFQGFQGGVDVASGDVDGDGFDDVIVGTRTGGSHVKVFSGADGSEIGSFIAFQGSRGGIDVASGDVDGDGFDDVIVGSRTGGSHVKIFSGRDGSLLQSYFAFPGYLGGVTVAAGDLNGDGRVDVVVGAATGSSHVKVFSGLDQSELRSFLALPGFTGDLTVAVADVNGDGVLDIVAGSRTGTSSVTSVDGTSMDATGSFLAFGGFLGGVEVG